ncbi:MAG: hypothetical protein IK008_02865 [Bacteroidales bacterium]|nr:hypothetical protein [Bacteroidales bacterium]
MKKLFYFGAAIAALSLMVACGGNKDNTTPEPGPGPDPTPEAGDVTKVCINEVCGVTGYKSVELYNADTKEVSLEGVALFKNDAEAATWTGTATDKIAAGGYFVIAAKKETGNITEIINATAGDSFSPKQTLKLELKKDAAVLSSFVRGEAPWGTEIESTDYSFGRTADGGETWRLLDITVGASNNAAVDHGEIPTTAPVVAESVTVNFKAWGAAQDPAWSDGAEYAEIVVNEFIKLTASWTEGSATHNGIWYIGNDEVPSDWRFYQARGGGMTITATGKELVSATFTYANKNGGIAVGPDSKQYESGVKAPLSGTSALFTVASTTGATNGQWRIQEMVIEYK